MAYDVQNTLYQLSYQIGTILERLDALEGRPVAKPKPRRIAWEVGLVVRHKPSGYTYSCLMFGGMRVLFGGEYALMFDDLDTKVLGKPVEKAADVDRCSFDPQWWEVVG